MPERAKLRQQAELYRRLASVLTTGGHDEDRVLLVIADDLEQKAATLDAIQGSASAVSTPTATGARGRGRLR